MAQLVLENVNETLLRKLETRALREGISVEDEHLKILKAVLEQEASHPLNRIEFLFTVPQAPPDEPEGMLDREADNFREIDLE